MSTIQRTFQEEVRRLARREIRKETASLIQQLALLKKALSVLQKTVKPLAEEVPPPIASPIALPPPEQDTEKKQFRMNGARIRKMREKVGLSQAELAKVIGVSPLTISHWEGGKFKPREQQKRIILTFRDMGKRERKALFDKLFPENPSGKKSPKAKSVKRKKAALKKMKEHVNAVVEQGAAPNADPAKG